MKSTRKTLSLALYAFASLSAFGLTACEQRYEIRTRGEAVATPATPLSPVRASSTPSDPSGSEPRTNPDGSMSVTSPDGTVTTTKPDGTVTLTQPDGTTTVTTRDGTTTITKPDGTTTIKKPDGSTTITDRDHLVATTEGFDAATKPIKKIDFLFVIDNSPSMEDNQKKLAEGFRAFANTFYRRTDLDICTFIITSDRYLGKEGPGGYQRERPLPCTKPSGSEQWSDDQRSQYIDSLITEFQTKAFVGTHGSPIELLGKSVVSFLYGLNQWGEATESSVKSDFFRKDAVANISFLTDENNYFFEGPGMDEGKNDLPYATHAVIPGAANGEIDKRKGIKEYLDAYFGEINGGRNVNYSVTSILELSKPSTTIPGISVNLDQLATTLGRESTHSDISGTTNDYTSVYQSIGDAMIFRASNFTLKHSVSSGLSVHLLHSSGEKVLLTEGADFTLQAKSLLALTPALLTRLQAGDKLDVNYNFTLEQN